jgi:hypothetical protein
VSAEASPRPCPVCGGTWQHEWNCPLNKTETSAVSAEAELVVYYGGARPGDDNYAEIVAVDADIVHVLALRERRAKFLKRENLKTERACD